MINRTLKLIRQFHQIHQSDLAIKFNMSKSYLSEIESGKKPASFELLEKYSNEFDIPASSLVFFSESISGKKNVPEKFRSIFTGKILDIMEWFVDKNDSKKEATKT
jgi:transcriptional regulator with XRE-family HTH domain